MLHVATVHHLSSKWIDLQLSYLRRHLHEPFRTVANLDGIDPVHHRKFDRIVPALDQHPGKLNLLAAVICAEADDDDLLMFLDGDAFPVADPMPLVRERLGDAGLVAVRRSEHFGDVQPHPIFCVTTVRTWKRIRGDWAGGHPWVNDIGDLVTDIGGNLLARLERNSVTWSPLLRTNRHNPHPLHFAVYGDVIYHHGAGFRSPWTRWERWETPPRGFPKQFTSKPVLGPLLRQAERARLRLWLGRRNRASTQLGERLYQEATTDPEFHRQLL